MRQNIACTHLRKGTGSSVDGLHGAEMLRWLNDGCWSSQPLRAIVRCCVGLPLSAVWRTASGLPCRPQGVLSPWSVKLFDEMLMNRACRHPSVPSMSEAPTTAPARRPSGPALAPTRRLACTRTPTPRCRMCFLHVYTCVSSLLMNKHIQARVLPHARVRLSRAHPYSCDIELQLHRNRCVRC